MLLCPAEARHLSATGRPEEHCNEGHLKQFAQAVTRIVGPGIGHLVKDGKKIFMWRGGFRRAFYAQESILPKNRKTAQIRPDPKRDSPDPEVVTPR